MDWLRSTTRAGGASGTKEAEKREAPAASSSSSSSSSSSTSKPSSLLAPAPFFGRPPSSTRRAATTTVTAAAAAASCPTAPPAMASSSSSFSTTLSEFGASFGEQLRGSSASLGALLKDATDVMSMLPPSAPPDPAPAAPVALAAEGEASAAGAVIRAKVRLAGLRLVVLEDEDDWTDSGGGSQCGPPFRVGPRTVVLATGADGGEILKEEQEKNEHSIELEWFRASMPGGALTPIPGVGVGSARYRPSADDVGSCISVQASLLTPITLQQQQQQHEGRSSCIDDTGGVQQPPTPHFAVFAEVGPFALSAHLQERLAGQEEPVVFKGLQEAEEGEYGGNGGPRHVYDLVVGPKYVELWSRPLAPVVKKRAAATRAAAPLLKEREPWSSSLSSDDEEDDEDGSSSGGSSDGEGEEGQEGELLGRGPYSLKTLVALHPHAPKVVLVQLPLFLLLDSSRPSLLPAEERSEQQVEEPSVLLQRALQLGSKEERDLLALLWRVRRREALQAQQGDQEEQEQEGAALDAVLLMSSLATAGRSPVVARVSSEGDGPEPEQARNALLETARLSSSSLGSSGDDGDGAVAEEGSAVLQEEEGSTVGEKKQTLERQQQEQQQQQQGHVRRARSSASGLGGLLMLGRGGAKDTNGEEQRSKEETVRGLKREAEALQRHVGQLEGQLEAANDEAAEARDHLAEARARIASLTEEAERLQVQEEALALQKTSNDQALVLARGEMERLRAEAAELREERDKDRAYFLGEVHGHALRLEAAESTIIEKERELGNAQKELGWVHEQWAGAQARIITLEEQGTALRQELAAWEEREARRRERRRVEQRVELQEKRQRQEQRRQEEEEKKVSSTKPFSPTSPGELLEESRLRCAAAEAQVRALEGRLKQQQAAKEALAKEAEAAARGLAAEREHTAVLLGERNGFRQRADSLARELSRVATRSLSQSLSLAQQQEGQGQQQQQQQRVPRSFDEAVAQLAQAQAEAQRLREELEELKALGTVAFTASSSTGTVAAPAASGGDNSTNSSSKNAERLPSSLRAMAAGALRRRKSSGGLSTIFRLPSQGEEGSPLTLPSPLPRSERARSGSGYADSGREAEMLQLLRSLTKSVQDKEAERLRAARRLERVEALARGAGMVVPPEEEGGVRVEEGRQEKAVVLMTADV